MNINVVPSATNDLYYCDEIVYSISMAMKLQLQADRKACKPPRLPDTTSPLDGEKQRDRQFCEPEILKCHHFC